MSESLPVLDYQGRKTRRVDGHARRQAILEAALRVISRDGVRGVRHRAVAAEAAVPLSATTYYFKDIQDLINDSFLYWVERTGLETRRLEEESLAAVAALGPDALRDPAARTGLIQAVTAFVVAHIRGQVAQREDRVLELAFKAEALRSERLAAVVRTPRQSMLQAIVGFLRLIAHPEPEAAAMVVLGSIVELEYQLLLEAEADSRLLEPAVRQLVTQLFS